jgi:hypothetical protein
MLEESRFTVVSLAFPEAADKDDDGSADDKPAYRSTHNYANPAIQNNIEKFIARELSKAPIDE